MNDGFFIESINIDLDASVQSLTRNAAMCLSGYIANGIVIAQNPNPHVKIYKNKIEFGECYNPDLYGVTGKVMTNYYLEFGNLVYYYDSAFKLSFWTKQLDYKGFFTPTEPDNLEIYNMIYPKFS